MTCKQNSHQIKDSPNAVCGYEIFEIPSTQSTHLHLYTWCTSVSQYRMFTKVFPSVKFYIGLGDMLIFEKLENKKIEGKVL